MSCSPARCPIAWNRESPSDDERSRQQQVRSSYDEYGNVVAQEPSLSVRARRAMPVALGSLITHAAAHRTAALERSRRLGRA
jgi:hypothetical protein